MTALGAERILGADDRLTVLGDSDVAKAEVIVVIEESFDDKVIAFLRKARAQSRLDSTPRCVIVTERFRVDGLTAIHFGTAAVLQLHTTTGEELLRTVVGVSQGTAFLPPWLQGSLLAHIDRMRRDVLEPRGLTVAGLSARERDVLQLVADGHNTGGVADRIGYSERMVNYILHDLMSRHELKTRAHAVAFAWRAGII
ncbi:hypothetical protein ALI144C_04410 [Actinosynnema sp. ALI-1.44]|nr:hypothetical protein ALI144C_04410 [Actinosynnema sp. ALI-1.44]